MDKFRLIDSYTDQKEIAVGEEQDLRDLLLSMLHTYESRVVILKSLSAGSLTIGIGRPYGFVEYSTASGEPPYLIAAGTPGQKPKEYYEFDSGGTPTPIPGDKCIPFDRVADIAVYFFKHAKLPAAITWMEE